MTGTRIGYFDTWQPGYGGAVVNIYIAGTTTLASVFSDEDLSVAAANPQTLGTKSAGGIDYGKWAVPLYVGVAVELRINSRDETGIIRPPLYAADGEAIGDATAIPTGGSEMVTIEDFMGRFLFAEDYGAIDNANTATNTATISAAIGAAAALGGCNVLLPAGDIPISQISLSQGVKLEGRGRGVTTLISQTGDKVVTIAGDRCGLENLTLDGINNVSASIAIFSKAKDEIYFKDIEIKRFQTGMQLKGGRRAAWYDVYVSTCDYGVKLHGDTDAGNGADGDECKNILWQGGKVEFCTTKGIEILYEDTLVSHINLVDIGFEDNTGTALSVVGARFIRYDSCWFDANTTHIKIEDDSPETPDNTVEAIYGCDGYFKDGAIIIEDKAQNVVFERIYFQNVDVTLTQPTANITTIDCVEDSETTIAGTGVRWLRRNNNDSGSSFGLTTDATVTKAWSKSLEPGQLVFIVATVIGRQQNSTDTGEYYLACGAKRAGATLAYDAQSANFTVGGVLTGGTSGATARIIADSDGGTSGTLTLQDIVGEFIDNEPITDNATGAALANGTLSTPSVSLLGSVTALRAAREDVAGWDATIAASTSEIEVRVTGAVGDTIEWTTFVQVVSS